MSDEMMSSIDMLFDENNDSNIVLYNDLNQPVEFEQIALIPLEGTVYAILKPVNAMAGMAEDEALVFFIDEIGGEDCLLVEEDDHTIDRVFAAYYELLKNSGYTE